jgi:hypothetical protein
LRGQSNSLGYLGYSGLDFTIESLGKLRKQLRKNLRLPKALNVQRKRRSLNGIEPKIVGPEHLQVSC